MNNRPINTKWEYKYGQILPPDHDQINRLGEEGWELVSVSHENGSSPVFYFKRQLTTQYDQG